MWYNGVYVATLQVYMDRVEVHSQGHNDPAGLESALEYSRRAANRTLANWFGRFRVFRDPRFSEGVTLGALREARYMALHHYGQMAAHPGWTPRVGSGFVLLPRGHYSVGYVGGDAYLDAPLGATGSGIAPLHAPLEGPPPDAYCGDILVTRDRVLIPYRPHPR